MKRTAKQNEEAPAGSVKKTISLPPEIYRKATLGAKREKRNFSNFIAHLVDADTARLATTGAK